MKMTWVRYVNNTVPAVKTDTCPVLALWDLIDRVVMGGTFPAGAGYIYIYSRAF